MKLKQFIFAFIAMLLGFSVTASAQQLLVNCDYNSSTEGYGTTKFSNYAGAYAYATANAKTATIVIEKTNTLSGNTFDNNHKNYSGLAVVIKDGATMGNAASKWDMTYPVTVEPGGTLTCARPKNASVSNIHIKNKLIVGAKGATKKAYVNFLSDAYQDCDISIRYNGSIEVYNADFYVQDLDAQGKLTIEDSNVEVDGAFASATFFATTLTNSTITINGNQISGGLSDFSGDESNQLGNVKLNNSMLTIKEGDTKVAANVTATNSTIAVNNLIVNSGKTLNLNDGSTLNAQNITTAGTGSVKIDGEMATIENGQIVLPVVQIGAEKYATLADAVAAATARQTITLIADIQLTEMVTIPEGKELTLDLNGKTVNSVFNNGSETNHIYALSNKGALTIKDSKGSGSINSRGIYNYGSLTLNAGAINAIDGNGGYAVNNQKGSTFVMNGGVVAATYEDDHQSSNGGYDATALKVPAGCTATLNGGIINNVCDFTYAIDAAGTLNIPATSTITVNGTHGAIAVSSGVTTIDAGTFQIPADNYSRTDNVLYVSGGSLVVNGGTFIGDSDTASGGSCLCDAIGTAVVNGGTFKGSSGGDVWGTTGTTIKGGTFENLTEKNYIAEGYELGADGTVVAKPVAEVNGVKYTTFAEAAAAVQAGGEIKLIANIDGDITVPANVTLNGNGKQINGNLIAGGEITFAGVTKVASFNVENVNTVVNIPAGASLQLTGTGRMVIGHGCTFNITGTITDAKSADKTTLTPSLVMPGASFTGAGVTFNVTNAYVYAPSSYCSSSKSASGTFDFNITNSIWESAGKLAFESQSTAATVNFDLVNSVLNTGSHLVFGVSRGEVIIDNSNVNLWKSNQIENQSTMTIKNGAVVNGAVATSSNAKNPGTIIVDNATYAVTGEFSGSDLGTGTIIIKKGAIVSTGSITKANITIDATDMTVGEEVNLTANLSKFAGTISVINNDRLEAQLVAGKIVLVAKVAMIGEQGYATLQAAIDAVKEGETITLVDDVNVTTPAYGQNALNHARAINFTLDLNGKTLSADTGNSVFRFNIANSGATSDVTLTIKNGKIVAGSNTWCAVMASGISSDVKAIMNLENLTIESSKANDMVVKSWSNATINAEKVTVNTTNAAGGFYAVGGEIVLDECIVNQKGLYTSPYMSMAFAVSSNGKMTINSGTYSAEPTAAAEGSNQGSTHGSWVGGVMNSGGELIINGGTFSNGNFGDDALATHARGLIFADSNGKVTVNGGTFNALKFIFDFQNNLGNNPPVITVKGGNYSADPAKVTSYGSIVLDANYVAVENNGVWTVEQAVAKVGEQGYATLEEAFKAATSGCIIEILSDVTVDSKWDCRYTGSKFTVPVTINGNGKTIKFTASVNDNNWNTVFRFEENATVNNLTVDISNTTGAQRVISAKKSLNVDGLNIVGAARYGVIYGEGASATDLAATEIVVKNSTLGATRRAVSDNEGGKDVKSVVIEGNTFNANVYVSASKSIAFNNNTVNGETDLRSYAADNVLNVQAQENTLAADKKNYIYAKTIVAQEGFETKNPPLKVATKAELNAALAAAKEGDVITLTADIDYGTDQLAIAKAITLDLGDKTLTTRNAWGGMSIKGNPTVKNGTIVHASNTAAIKVWNATAFEDLVIDVQGKGDANKTIGGIVLQSGSTTRVGSIKNVTIKGAALTNGIETYNCGDATENVIGAMENVTIDAQGTGMLISAPCGTATNCNIKGGTNGIEIWIKGNYSASLDLVDSNIDGGVYAHDEFSSYPDVVNNGTLKFTADEQTTGAKAENVTLTIARAEKVEGVLKEVKDNAIAKGKNTYYATLEEAIKAAAPAGTVELLKDVTVDKWITISETLTIGDGTVITLPMNGLTIDGQNHTLTIKEVVSPEREDFLFHNATNLNVKNLTISCVGSDVYDGGISLMSGRIENVTFNGGKYGVLPGANGVTVTGCTFNGTTGYAIYYEEAREGIVVTGNTFNTADGAYAITMRSNEQFTNNTIIKGKVNIANSSSANVTGNNFGTERFKVYNAATATIKENTINNLVFNDNSAVNSTFAENTLSAEAQAVLDASKAYGKQAKIGGTYYATIANAITAAQAGEIVTILTGTYKVPQMKAGITVVGEGEVLLEGTLSGTLENLTLKNLHIKGGNAQRWAYAKGDLVFENVTFEATSVYALHFDGIAEGTNLTYKNCTIIGWAAMGGSPASCVFDGCTIKGNGTYGVIRTYFDATIKDCTFDVANVNTNDAYQDGIHAVEGAKVTVTNSTNVNGDMKDLVNIHGASVVTVDGVAYKNVVKIDDNYYATLAEAFAEIGDGTGKTVELIADVDLAGAEWTPVTFNGVFDGQNHTISNLVVNGAGKSNQGFFAQTNNGEIKNVTFNNAKITGRLNVGVVAGTPYTSKYTNVKVTGHVEVNGMAYVGGVGGKNAYADWTDITVDVDETSYVKATSTENDKKYRTYVGGVIGFNGEGGHTFKNISSNIKVIGDVMDIGGIFGILHYGNNAENITFTGAVEAPASATEVGGIAGVWHNEKGQTVTITNAISEGTVKVGDVTTTGSLVGGAYNAENQSPETSGSLIIDGKEAWVGVAKIGDKPYATLADAITAAQVGDTITLIADVTGDVTISKALTFEGQGKTYTGAMTLKADATFNNVNFDGKGYNGYAITTRGASYLTINGGSAKNYGYGFVQLASGTVLTTVKDVTVSNVNYGIKVDYSNAVVLENVDITAGVAALLNSNYGEKTISIKGSKFNILGTWVRNNTVKTTYVFDGANTVGKFITDASIDNFKLTAGATLTAPADQNVTTDVADYKVIYQDGTYMAVADKVTIVDGAVQNFVNAKTYEVGTLTYQRQFVDGVWNSLFVPFEIPISALSDYDVAYINDMHSYDKDNDGVIEEFGLEVIYIKDPNATLNASHPYVIRPKNADACDMNLVLNNANLYNSTDKTEVTCSSAYMNFAFNGTYSIIPVEEGDRYYVLALDEDGNTTFGYAAPGTTLKPFRFFFTMESRGGSYVKVDDAALKTIRIYVQGEGDTTGIVGAEFNTNAADQIFDLQGRRVTTPVKGGVYIVNGKKVYINK